MLDAIVRAYEVSAAPGQPGDVTRALGLEEEEVARAVRALDSGGYLRDVRYSASGFPFLTGVPTGEARRAVGAWPTPESLAERLVVAMDQAAEVEQDAEVRGWLRRLSSHLGGAGRDLAVEIAAATLNRQLGN